VAAPARAGWREASSDNFIVYSDGGESALVNFTQRAEKFDQLLRNMTGLKRTGAESLRGREYFGHRSIPHQCVIRCVTIQMTRR